MTAENLPGRSRRAVLTEALAPYVCEFVGSFLLVVTVGCNILTKTSSNWAPTSIACMLMVMIYAFGAVSGGNLNPAVSLACGLSKKGHWSVILGYIAAQVCAGMIAGFSTRWFFGRGASIAPKGDFNWWEVMIVEALYTAMIAFVVLNVAASKTNNPQGNGNQFFALAIGFVVIAGGHAAGGISGASFNPAVSIGLDISSYDNDHSSLWGLTYACYQVVGAAIAALLFRVVRIEEFLPKIDSEYVPSLPTKMASEFIGTFMLVFTVGLNVLSQSSATPWSAAAALMCMIYSLGDVSGGHFNPAVTLAVCLSGRKKCPRIQALAYAVIQTIAGIIAGLLYASVYEGETFPLKVTKPYTVGAALWFEFFFTFVISFVVLTTATVQGVTSPTGRNFYFALAIGSCVTAAGFASGKVSGGQINPAVSFGIAASNLINGGDLGLLWKFVAAELLGGACAAGTFMVTHARDCNEYKRRILSGPAAS